MLGVILEFILKVTFESQILVITLVIKWDGTFQEYIIPLKPHAISFSWDGIPPPPSHTNNIPYLSGH